MKRTAENDEFLRKRKLRQKRIRKRRIFLFSVFFLILLAVVGVVLSLTVLFPIKNIVVKGSEKYTAEQIIAACGIAEGDNLFIASAEPEQVRGLLPYVETLRLGRSLPDTLTVSVTDAVEYACYNVGGVYYTVSRSGYVLAEYAEKPADLTEIVAAEIECTPGKRVHFADSGQEELIQTIETCAEDNGIALDKIDITDELSLTVGAAGRFTVQLGTSNYLDKKLAHLAGMMKSIDPQKTGKINLSMWTAAHTEGTFVEDKQ